jgi:hypothetical protein
MPPGKIVVRESDGPLGTNHPQRAVLFLRRIPPQRKSIISELRPLLPRLLEKVGGMTGERQSL